MTESQSVVQRHDDGSFAEVGTWTHDGVPFSAEGAFRSPDGAIVFGYVRRDAATGRFTLTMWGGERIADLTPRGRWRGGFPRWGAFRSMIHAWSATIDGATYHGRNGGEGMCVSMRRSARNGGINA